MEASECKKSSYEVIARWRRRRSSSPERGKKAVVVSAGLEDDDQRVGGALRLAMEVS